MGYWAKLNTLALGARWAMSAAAAFPALFSSIKLIVELIISRVMIPTKSCQSGGFPYKSQTQHVPYRPLTSYTTNRILFLFLSLQICSTTTQRKPKNFFGKKRSTVLTPPLARAMAMIAAASITHERGFHINPRNFKTLLSCITQQQRTNK